VTSAPLWGHFHTPVSGDTEGNDCPAYKTPFHSDTITESILDRISPGETLPGIYGLSFSFNWPQPTLLLLAFHISHIYYTTLELIRYAGHKRNRQKAKKSSNYLC